MTAILFLRGPAFGAERPRTRSSPCLSPHYLGFDRNTYPGDAALAALRRTFSFTGYWLNTPPSAPSNTWAGKRAQLEARGFGFLVIFNGRADAELKSPAGAAALGNLDAAAAVAAARREGFPAGTVIFLDQEEGGRLLPEQLAYLYAWMDGVNAGGFRAGVYCSGMRVPSGPDRGIITAQNIRKNSSGRKIVFWVYNCACPPSPGCAYRRHALSPAASGVRFAAVWQFAQSPRRDAMAACPANYAPDGNCYPPGFGSAGRPHVDLDVATSLDPSHGRTATHKAPPLSRPHP